MIGPHLPKLSSKIRSESLGLKIHTPEVQFHPEPPKQLQLTRLAGLCSAQSPVPRGAFCCGLLTDPIATRPQTRLKPRFVSGIPDFFAVERRQGVGENFGFWRRTD